MAHTAEEAIGPLPPADSLRASYVWVGTYHRDPLIRLFADFDVPNAPKDPAVDHLHAHGSAVLDPRTRARLPADVEGRLALGTGFFFPMHYMLHIGWLDLGYWIVGLAGMVMLAALVSGVVMHRKIFREFFTFRPDKSRQRSILDLHNMTGVLALPFLFVITFSGVLIFNSFYLPSNWKLMRPFVEAQQEAKEARTGLPHDPAGKAAELASIDAMMAAAKAHWAAQGVPGEIGSVAVTHIGDANAYVSISRDTVDRVATAEILHFKGVTGELLYEKPPASPISAANDFLYALHFQWFKHWGVRWLLLASGFVGCACIATGFLFFVEKRRNKHAAAGLPGARVVDALAVTAVTGMLVATTTMMLANRLLPVGLPYHGEWQQAAFWVAWLAALVHAALRSGPVAKGGTSPAWSEQCWAASALAIAAVLANWTTTGDHLVKTIGEGYWPVAGVDLVLLVGAGALAWTGYRLGRRNRSDGQRKPAGAGGGLLHG